MRILITSMHFFPEEFRINEISRELARRGYEVEVVTGQPNYPQGEIFEGYADKMEEDYEGFWVHRSKIRPRHHGFVNLFFNYFSFVVSGKKTVRRLFREGKQFDLIFSYETSPVHQIAPAKLAKHLFKAPLICMCCDQWPESLKVAGLKGGPAYAFVKWQSRKLYGACDFILNTSPSFVDYNYQVNKIPKEKQSWFLQHSEDPFREVSTAKTGKDADKTTDLLFAGNIGHVQNVADIVRAYAKLNYPDLRIHIVGDGSEYEACKALSQELGVDKNVIFYGRKPVAEMISYYRLCDACLLTLSGTSAIGNTIPSKLQGYMSASKPVLAAINGDSRQILDEAQCGLYTDPDDAQKLADMIQEYYQNRDRYADYGKNGRAYFEQHCTLETFMAYLERLFAQEGEKK